MNPYRYRIRRLSTGNFYIVRQSPMYPDSMVRMGFKSIAAAMDFLTIRYAVACGNTQPRI